MRRLYPTHDIRQLVTKYGMTVYALAVARSPGIPGNSRKGRKTVKTLEVEMLVAKRAVHRKFAELQKL